MTERWHRCRCVDLRIEAGRCEQQAALDSPCCDDCDRVHRPLMGDPPGIYGLLPLERSDDDGEALPVAGV